MRCKPPGNRQLPAELREINVPWGAAKVVAGYGEYAGAGQQKKYFVVRRLNLRHKWRVKGKKCTKFTN